MEHSETKTLGALIAYQEMRERVTIIERELDRFLKRALRLQEYQRRKVQDRRRRKT